MGIRISQVDAFTDRPFAGNPAAVCVLSEPADEKWMQDCRGRDEPLGNGIRHAACPAGPGSTCAGSHP